MTEECFFIELGPCITDVWRTFGSWLAFYGKGTVEVCKMVKTEENI